MCANRKNKNKKVERRRIGNARIVKELQRRLGKPKDNIIKKYAENCRRSMTGNRRKTSDNGRP